MKINADEYHFSFSTNNTVEIKIGNSDVTNSKREKILEVKFDNKLSFDDDISELCRKAGRKIRTLSRVASYMDISKGCVLMNGIFKPQFSYCLLVWMCDSPANNGKTNRPHKRWLQIIHSDKQSSFETLLEKMALLLFTVEIFKSFQLKCIK